MNNSDEYGEEVGHERAICPECGYMNVTVLTAPVKPPKMYCTDCGWDSLDGGNNA